MAFIETKANQVIIDQANAFNGYVTMTNGYADGYGTMFSLTYSGSILTIGTGLAIQNGFKWFNDTLYNLNVGTTTSGTTNNKVYAKLDMANPSNVTFVYDLATVTKTSDNLFRLSNTGIAYVEIGTFTKGTSGVTSATKTIPKAIFEGLQYSTTIEQKTGRKWVDGKDIYEKTFLVASITAGNSATITVTGSTNILFIEGFATDTTTNAKVNLFYSNEANVSANIGVYSTNATTVRLAAGSIRNFTNAYVVVKYTK